MRKNIFNLRTLITLALLAAIGAVCSAFLSFDLVLFGIKVSDTSLTPVPVMLAGILFGPLAGGLVGFIADTAGFFMTAQNGAYNPIFSVTMALFGVIAGLFFLKNQKGSIWRTSAMSGTALLVCSLVLNTFFVWILYFGGSWEALRDVLLLPRIISFLIKLPIYSWLLMLLTEALKPVVNKSFRPQTT